jgi:hypothetical protein
MSEPMFLTLNEVVERYRGQISEGTFVQLAFYESWTFVLKIRLRNSIGGTAEASSSAGPSDYSW